MYVAAVQYDIAWEDREANFAKVRSLIAAADVPAGAMIVLPEMFSTGFSMDVDAVCEGEKCPGECFLADLAVAKEAVVLGGVVSRADDGRGRNEALLVGPNWKELARYVKMHPFSYAGETDRYAPGDRPVLAEWAGAKLSPFLCYDLRFPEVFRTVTTEGAEVLVVLANWPEDRREHWRALLRARAIENQAYVVGVNRVGQDPNARYAGDSVIVGPRGEVLAEAGAEEAVIQGEMDLEALRAYRREFPALWDIKRGWVKPLE